MTFLVVLVLLLAAWVGYLHWQQFSVSRRFSRLLKGTKGDNLEHLLIEHMKKLSASMEEIEKAKAAYEYLEAMTTRSLQKVGLVRFNPFHDTGSDQSFALALLDLYDNGVVISGIHGREGTRVYAKMVRGGESQHHLSAEEIESINQAREFGNKQQKVARREAHASKN